jgi:hypothetical protein
MERPASAHNRPWHDRHLVIASAKKPRCGWNQITIIRCSTSRMTFSRGQRIATLTLVPVTISGPGVDFVVAPSAYACTGISNAGP